MSIELMLVDDCDFSAATIQRILESWQVDASLTVFSNPETAVSRLGINAATVAPINPDIIVLDLGMPRMDGFEVLSSLRDDTRYCDLPVVIYSASEDPEDKSRSLSLGADSFLQKSASVMELHTALERAISRRWSQKQAQIKIQSNENREPVVFGSSEESKTAKA